MSANANEYEAEVVNTSYSTIQLPNDVLQAFLIGIALLVVVKAVVVISSRNMSPNANEQHEADYLVTKSKSNSTIPLPTHVLRHCLSFLGSTDNYYFLASVCKDFKTAVEQLYGDNRNTSAESIIATVSTCNHVHGLIFEDMDLMEDEKMVIIDKIAKTVFDNDRVDILKGSFMPVGTTVVKEIMLIVFAIVYRSTEIMRVIIKDKENVQFMKDHTSDNDVPIASYAPAACDVSMIKELIRSGVAFNATSLLFALRRDDLATFEYLLDVAKVRISDRKEKEKGERIVFEALLHEKYKDAFEMLMRNGFICFTNLREALIYMIALKNPTLDRVKFLLNEIETDDSDEFFHRLVSVCVKMRRMDILSYINTSIRDIDVESYILDVFNDDEEAVEFLRGML